MIERQSLFSSFFNWSVEIILISSLNEFLFKILGLLSLLILFLWSFIISADSLKNI